MRGIASRFARAWMAIGTAARLEALFRLSQSRLSSSHLDDDTVSRCHWSIFILGRMVLSQDPDLLGSENPTTFPQSIEPPRGASMDIADRFVPVAVAEDELVYDLGINAYCMQVVSIWGELVGYHRQIRAGKVEVPWATNSRYHQLVTKTYNCEAQLSSKHLLKNTAFHKQTLAELLEHREYWDPWLLRQITSHAIQAILNHPFIHLVAFRGTARTSSRLFLQQAVDQALFHSRWVSWLVHACEDLQYDVNDPFIGQVVAMTATIPCLFQFAGDPKVSEKAREDLAKCNSFVNCIAKRWPHVAAQVRD